MASETQELNSTTWVRALATAIRIRPISWLGLILSERSAVGSLPAECAILGDPRYATTAQLMRLRERLHNSQPPHRTPWGQTQHAEALLPGVWRIETISHGGIWIDRYWLPAIPTPWREFAAKWSKGEGDQWYEEDCAIIAPLAFLMGSPHALESLPECGARHLT